MAGALFGIAAVALLSARPLWLDEILQLRETTTPSAGRMIANLPRNAGAAPLGYLTQHAMLRFTGYSVRRARLTAAIFGVAAVISTGLLAAELGLDQPWIAAALFALFPMTLRYATESRVYSEALFFSVLATLAYLRLAKRPDLPHAAAYWLILTAAAYTQPYAASVGVAHVLWSAGQRERRAAFCGAAALGGAVLAFLPWYTWSKASWGATVAGGALDFAATWKTPLLILRELTGGGYACLILLAALCVMALWRGLPNRRAVFLLLSSIALPLLCIFGADAALDYFVAGRQFLWVLPPLAILAAAAFNRPSRVAIALAALAGVICILADLRYFTRPAENWAVAADAVAVAVRQGACFAVAPPGDAFLYEFFRPELERAHCEAPTIVLAITPYTTPAERNAAVATLAAQGYRSARETQAGGSLLIFLQR